MRAQESQLTASKTVNDGIDGYSKLHEDSQDARNAQYQALVNAYYDLATVFYEWGWGQSFHFCLPQPSERFAEAIRVHEYKLAAQLENVAGPKRHLLDVGCGIGGPMRNIAKFLDCQVTGITLNPYQVARGNQLTSQDRVLRDGQCKSVQGDFMKLPFEDGSFDGVYAIEATCHAPDRVACYGEILRVLKPGATFACYEWCLTDKYDPDDAEHRRMKKDIELGNGLPDIISCRECLQAMEDAGFEVSYECDLAASHGPHVETWMTPLMPSWNIFSQRFQFNSVGGPMVNAAIAAMETLRLAPAGTVKTQKVLQAGGFALRDAGELGIFTTMYMMVGKKKAP